MGQTPFHSYEMKDLLAKINEGKYMVATKDPLSIECALFLTQCLQANEFDRISGEELLEHPFIRKGDNEGHVSLTMLDMRSFFNELFNSILSS